MTIQTIYSRRVGNAQQRSFYHLDAELNEQVEAARRVIYPEPFQIPVGEASESSWGEFQEAQWGDL